MIVCFIMAAAAMCSLHSSVCVCARASGTVGDRLASPCVADCSVSSKDKQWRVERVICLLGLNSSPWSPAGLSSLLFSLFSACCLFFFSLFVEGEEHFSHGVCTRLFFFS